MEYCFEPNPGRQVIISNHMVYTVPEIHPDRVMDEHDIFYVIEGQENVVLENEEYWINPGDVMLLPAGYRHFGKHLYKPDTHAIYIHFSMEKGDHKVNRNEMTGDGTLVMPVFMQNTDLKAYEYFLALVNLYLSPSPRNQLGCSAFLNLLLLTLSSSHRGEKCGNDEIINGVLSFLASHPHKFYSITQLADYSGLSPRCLTSHFKTVTGQPVHQYQMDSKLNQIALLLRNGSFSNLVNLSTNFGFYDEYHLNACFKKKFGISPIRYSRQTEIF